MGLFDFLKRKASRRESSDSSARMAAALKVAHTPDKPKAVDLLIDHYENVIGVSRYVSQPQWQEVLQNWKQNRNLSGVVLFLKTDCVASFQADGVNSRFKQVRDLVLVLEEFAKSMGGESSRGSES